MCRLKVIQVIGKRSRPVPILITQDMFDCLTVLSDTRAECGVLQENRFFFAVPGFATGHLHFYTVLRRVAQQAQLQKPERVTTTRLREHLATVAQV